MLMSISTSLPSGRRVSVSSAIFADSIDTSDWPTAVRLSSSTWKPLQPKYFGSGTCSACRTEIPRKSRHDKRIDGMTRRDRREVSLEQLDTPVAAGAGNCDVVDLAQPATPSIIATQSRASSATTTDRIIANHPSSEALRQSESPGDRVEVFLIGVGEPTVVVQLSQLRVHADPSIRGGGVTLCIKEIRDAPLAHPSVPPQI